MRSLLAWLFGSLLIALQVVSGKAQESKPSWKPAPAPLMTKWGKEISPEITPWPEYPRPQLVRDKWQNLNGLWSYAVVDKGADKSSKAPAKWDGEILVPFCIESALSGVGKRVSGKQELWYRREVEIPADWNGQNVLLHFGAVDFESTVFVNGTEVGFHRGGNNPFSYDITKALKPGSKNELLVKVWDPTDEGAQPRGKQIRNPHGIWYTPVTGIWQTVWMEPVAKSHFTSISPIAKLSDKSVEFEFNGVDLKPTDVIHMSAAGDAKKYVGKFPANGKGKQQFADAKLWTPDSPELCDLVFKIERDGKIIDTVQTYFAMREIKLGKDEKGVQRLLLNGKPLFQMGPLDQGWWPDGLLTPPSDEAMASDLKVLKSMGMNMLRKHIKVEPARLYHHCDKLGLLVWQDMPSGMIHDGGQQVQPNDAKDVVFKKADDDHFRAELKEMIDHLKFFACIVVWVPFNEGWGQHDTNEILKWTKEYDPTRLVNGPSGWTDRGYGDMKDMHNYPGPGMFPVMNDRASVLGEYGGLGLPTPGHLWKQDDNWGYRSYKNQEDLRRAYRLQCIRLAKLREEGLAAAVYTQTTDVGVEVNGYLTYDREVNKFDPAEMKKWHEMVISGKAPTLEPLVATSEKAPQNWRYTTTTPAGEWMAADFDATKWLQGPSGFGTKDTPGTVVRTQWNNKDIWIRREFELNEAPTGEILLRMHHDEDADVYLNGVKAGTYGGYTTGYTEEMISADAANALKPGKNVIAIKVKQTGGGQYIDAGLVRIAP
jgi:hypothetical protein